MVKYFSNVSVVYTILVIHVSKLTNMEWKTCVRQKSAPTAQTFAAVDSAIVIAQEIKGSGDTLSRWKMPFCKIGDLLESQ